MNSHLGSKKGSVLLETLFSLWVVIMAISSGLATTYLGLTKIWCQWCLYESLICLEETRQSAHCKTQLKKRVSQLLPIGKI